jgi:formylglycine-generating enzyme required for sulfatase activity
MGLPPSYVGYSLADESPLDSNLVGLSQADLVKVVESVSAPLQARWAAGSLLALKSDPRIDVFHPSMISIPGGSVSIGLESNEIDAVMDRLADITLYRDWIEKECPRHDVTLAPYSIGKYPVTNQEYLTFLQETGHHEIPTSWIFGRFPLHQSNHPVHTISADAADAYAAWLSSRTGRNFRLPSEKEWEFAASGPENFEYPWGQSFAMDHANTIESGLVTSSPIGMFAKGRSPFGLFDMAGNVEEYVADDYQSYPGGKTIEDDLLLSRGSYRVARGGSFTRFRDLARCKRRHGRYEKDIYVMGFRLSETI